MKKIWNFLTNLTSGRIKDYNYKRQTIPSWNVGEDECFFLYNVNILDVNQGYIKPEKGILIRNGKIEELLPPSEFSSLRSTYRIKKELDGGGLFLIPGLSDIHCHITLVSEFGTGFKDFAYFPAQRLKNSEEALKKGCTFIRDCASAVETISYIKKEIKENRLLGPKIMTSTNAISPSGGMWDLGYSANMAAPLLFGGKILHFPRNRLELNNRMIKLYEGGCDFFKTYFEDKPIYGFTEDKVYNMFTIEDTKFIRKLSRKLGKKVAAHSMFIKGSKRVIEEAFDTLEHLTVDEPYSIEDAKKMAKNKTAIIPTLSLGCYTAINCGKKGFPDDPEVEFFHNLRNERAITHVQEVALSELKDAYLNPFAWLNKEEEDRKIPVVGQVYPKRMHGYARYAPESIKNFQEEGVKVGVGTDGGTGITFCGFLENEFLALSRYGYSNKEIIRMATLGNMEILDIDKEMGSLDKEKWADMVLLEENPLDNLTAIKKVVMVFKDGRLYYEKKPTSPGPEK